MTQTASAKCKKTTKKDEEFQPFLPEDSQVIVAPRKRSCGCYFFIATWSLILGILISLSVLKRRVDCVQIHTQPLGLFLAPPPHAEIARVARYLMHTSNWCSLSTFSTHKGIEGYPFVNIFSFSDGPRGNSSGIPYFYATYLDLSLHDLKIDNRTSITVTESQSGYCGKKGYDPQSPLCARVILTGTFEEIASGSEEEAFARLSLFSRHPEMPDWPVGHDFFFAKLNISLIYILDFFGGAKTIPLKDYFEASPYTK